MEVLSEILKGIAQWGCVSGVEQLDVHGTNVIYTKSKNDEKDETPLEPNHTDFIFIDDGTKHQYGAEIQFRNQFERTISDESISLNIPVVLVVIEGGIDTIKKGFYLSYQSFNDILYLLF